MNISTRVAKIILISGIVIVLFGLIAFKFWTHISFSDIKGKFNKQTQVVSNLDNKYSQGNYLLGANSEALILEELIKHLGVSVSISNNSKEIVDVLIKENLVKSNVAFLENYPKTEPLYIFIGNTLASFSAFGKKDVDLKKENILISLDNSKILLLKVNEDRFSVPFLVLDTVMFFDVVKEDGKYKIDFLSPILNCEERVNFFKFLNWRTFSHQFEKYSLVFSNISCYDHFNALETISTKAKTYNLLKDRTFNVHIDYAGEKEFLGVYLLSKDIFEDIQIYFNSRFPGKKIDRVFIKNNFPDEILKKYFPDDYNFISTYEYTYPPSAEGMEVKNKLYKDFAVNFLLNISGRFVGSFVLSQDGTVKDYNGSILDKKNIYNRLLVDINGGVIFVPDRYATKIYFKKDGTFEKIDLLYYFDTNNCSKEGPRIFSLLEARCNYFEDYKIYSDGLPFF